MALFYFMLKSQKEMTIFYKGIDYFNDNQYKKAHKEWEILWKHIGHVPRRQCMKVFLQLTGIYQNIGLKKLDAVRYGIRVATQRLEENNTSINQWVDVDSIESFLMKYENKNIPLKAFDELVLKRKWGRVHKDLGTK
jgi:hypothetical protein